MNKNILIGLVVAFLVIVGVVMVSNNSKTTTQANPEVENQTPSKAPAMKGESSKAPENAMEKENVTTVTLTSAGFEPKTVTIKKGEKVVWVNKSGGPATVDSAQHPTHLVYPKLNLGGFSDGEKLELVFDEVGKYNYHDHLNPSRFGTVVVE